jgi:DNA-binding NtrC family response regulator
MNETLSVVRAPCDDASLVLVGESAALAKLRTSVLKVAATKAPVLITGETGTGKELVARMVHGMSSRAAGPFIAVNCAALPAGLFQAEVFGSEKGAYTGAYRRSLGRIEAAQGGTLFLDEIGDLAMDMQTTLLRFLEEGSFERLGSVEPIQSDVRIVTATHAVLEQRCRDGLFREDLFYRLNALHLETPPLRDRGSDIQLLAEHFLRLFSAQFNRRHLRFEESARRRMSEYAWPGNIRELRNRIMQALVMCEGDFLSARDLGLAEAAEAAGTADADHGPNGAPRPLSLKTRRQMAEREAIIQALHETHGLVPAAASSLGISRAQLYRLIGQLHVPHHLREGGSGAPAG